MVNSFEVSNGKFLFMEIAGCGRNIFNRTNYLVSSFFIVGSG